jgi:uncharacterized protein
LVSFLAGGILAVALAPHARAASFDCAKAATPTEKLICGNPQLSQLDGQLALAYQRALAGAAEPDRLRAEQRAWLRTERKACADAPCLQKVYTQRLAALAATSGPQGAAGQAPAESAPIGSGSGGPITLAPVLDKAKGDAALAAYNKRPKRGDRALAALASGSFTRAGADEVLLVVPHERDFTGSPYNSTLVVMQKTATGFRIARRTEAGGTTGTTFEVRARISGPGRPDRLYICDSSGRQGVYPMSCGFLYDSAPNVQMGSATDCGPAVNIAPGKLRVDRDRVAVDVVVDEYVLAESDDPKDPDCTKQTKKSSQTFVLTYQLGAKNVRLLTPIPPRINELVEKFGFDEM